MTIDVNRMANELVEARKMLGGKGNLWKIPEGETRVFVHGQCYPDDDHPATAGYNFVKVMMHHGVGGKKGGIVCLDAKTNPVITHPIIVEFLANRKKGAFKLNKNQTCPVCEALASGDIKGEDSQRVNQQPKWLWGLTPMFFRTEKTEAWTKLKFEPKLLMSSVSVFNGIAGDMIDNANAGIDVTDPKAAVLAKIGRTGSSFGDTNYEVKFDVETIRKPIMLDKGQRRLLADAMEPGGTCDLFRCVANLMKAPAAVKGLMVGARIEEDDAEDDRKSCFGIDYDPKDSECKGCEELKACAEAVEGAEDSEGEQPRKKAMSASVPTRQARRQEPVEEPEESEGEAEAEAEAEAEVEAAGDDAEGEPEGDDAVDVPQCFATYEATIDDCASCICKAECKAETLEQMRAKAKAPARSPVAAQPPKGKVTQPAAEEEDPELAAIEREAQSLAAKNKGKSRPIGKK